MRKCNRRHGGDAPFKKLVKAARKGACLIVFALDVGMTSTYAHEKEELYQDPYADPNVKVGQHAFEKVEPAEQHEGRYSVRSYEFRGKGPAHKMSDVRKYDLDHTGSRGSKVSVKVHIEWPEENSGLSKNALAKVRKTILWMAFAHVPETIPYTSPESLGETEETLRKRDKEIWAREGEQREIGEFGLQPADWAKLVGDALSHKTGRLPAKDDGRVTTKALELGMAGIKEYAQSCYKCAPPEKMNGSWWHCCSRWTFAVDLHLDWPFGFVAKENAEWNERPVLCVWNEGHDRDGGNGCHDRYCSKVFSLPDGRELGIEDYFAPDKLKSLSAFVTKRFYDRHLDKEEAAERSKWPLDLTSDEVSMQVTKDGIKWTWAPYSILQGCYGAPSIFIKWKDLGKFKVKK